MRHVATLVIGMVLLVAGGQGGIRLLADHGNAGILARLPGGFPGRLGCFAPMAFAGAVLTARGGAHVR